MPACSRHSTRKNIIGRSARIARSGMDGRARGLLWILWAGKEMGGGLGGLLLGRGWSVGFIRGFWRICDVLVFVEYTLYYIYNNAITITSQLTPTPLHAHLLHPNLNNRPIPIAPILPYLPLFNRHTPRVQVQGYCGACQCRQC